MAPAPKSEVHFQGLYVIKLHHNILPPQIANGPHSLSERERASKMKIEIFVLLFTLSLVAGDEVKHFKCPDKICTEEMYNSMSPCVFTDIDDAGKCLCMNNCEKFNRDQGVCNTIKCTKTDSASPTWSVALWCFISSTAGSLAGYAFSRRHKLKVLLLDGIQTVRQWRTARMARAARRNAGHGQGSSLLKQGRNDSQGQGAAQGSSLLDQENSPSGMLNPMYGHVGPNPPYNPSCGTGNPSA